MIDLNLMDATHPPHGASSYNALALLSIENRCKVSEFCSTSEGATRTG